MGKQKSIQCRHCCADIFYKEDASFIRCSWCGCQMELPGASEEEKQILAAVEQARQATESAQEAVEKSTAQFKKSAEENAKETARKLEQLLAESQSQKAIKRREKLMEMYRMGAELQRAGRFEDAAKQYQAILADEPGEAEARWQLTMCRYGVEYVCSDADGEYVPTICHLREDSILEDVDFKAAMDKAQTAEMRAYYEREAKHIHAILSKYIEIRSKESCDVFISVKQGDQFGNPTKDSIIARDIYDLLTQEHGLKVFNSQISLQKHAGEEWEPHIMAALLSAKVMLVVGTKPDNMTAPWVRNEWRRFRWIMNNRPGKRTLIPCVGGGMSPSDLPAEMGYLQAVNLNDLNGRDALVRAVAGALSIAVGPGQAKSAAIGMPGVFQLIQEKKWSEADAAIDALLKQNETSAAKEGAYYAKLLCERKAASLSALRSKNTPLENSVFYAKALEHADEALRKQLQECNLYIVQRGAVGDVWRTIQTESEGLEKLSAGAGLAPIFREAYEQNGAALEAYKDDFNAYMEKCRKADLEPIQTQLKIMRGKVSQLEKKCIENRKWLSGKDDKADKMQDDSRRKVKGRSWLGTILGLLLLASVVFFGYAVYMGYTSVIWIMEFRDISLDEAVEAHFAYFPRESHILAFVCVGVFLFDFILLIRTRKLRASQRQRSIERKSMAMTHQSNKAHNLKLEIESTQAELTSMEKSIANYKTNIETLEKEERRILDLYPHF